MAHVLLIEDDAGIRTSVVRALHGRGHAVDSAGTGLDGLQAMLTGSPDVVVLDLGLPDVDGERLLGMIRAVSQVPVIVATARDDEGLIVSLLDAGADDYVVKPFSPRELAARVNGVLRRTTGRQATPPGPIVFGELSIDPLSREVTLEGRAVEMTPKEFDVLAFLASSPRQVFSRAQLLESVWQSSPEWQDPATVTVHVRRIRNKIEVDPETPRWITTVWGVGYRFEP